MPSPEASRRNGKLGGRPKGYKLPRTLEKEALRNHLVQRVAAEFDPIIDAAISSAKGLKHLVARDQKTGKYERVSPEQIGDPRFVDDDGNSRIEVWEKDPNVAALTDLLNRTLDKPKEQPQDVNMHLSGDISALLEEGRARVAAGRKKE